MTEANRLRVQSGRFRAFIDCIEGELPHQAPSGDFIEIDGEQILKAFQVLQPFVGNDASRPWVNGILLRGQSAYATNNMALVEYWIGAHTPFIANIPIQAVKEVERVGIPPQGVQLDENSLTFHYPDGRWIRTALFSTEWPDLNKVLDTPDMELTPIPEGFFEGLDTIRPFIGREDLVYFRNGGLRTDRDDELGAFYEIEGLPEGIYRGTVLRLLQGAAERIDLGRYPYPCPFQGPRLRGVIIGLRP